MSKSSRFRIRELHIVKLVDRKELELKLGVDLAIFTTHYINQELSPMHAFSNADVLDTHLLPASECLFFESVAHQTTSCHDFRSPTVNIISRRTSCWRPKWISLAASTTFQSSSYMKSLIDSGEPCFIQRCHPHNLAGRKFVPA